MKTTRLSSLLLSTFLVDSAYAASVMPTARDMTAQEMNDVVGQGRPIFHIRGTGPTRVYFWNKSHNHSHQAIVPAGNYYVSFHPVPAGDQTAMKCQDNFDLFWSWVGPMPAGDLHLHCHTGPG